MFHVDKTWLRALATDLSGRDDGFPEFREAVVLDQPLFRGLTVPYSS